MAGSVGQFVGAEGTVAASRFANGVSLPSPTLAQILP